MERRDIIVTRVDWDEQGQEWLAKGSAERYGSSVPWEAYKSSGDTTWTVQIPARVPGDGITDDDHLLVLDDEPLAPEVASALARHIA
ncbi:MAG: hypothetical protein ACPGU1_18710 [Myxococcota bacterium]